MSNGLGVLFKLVADVRPHRQSDRDCRMRVAQKEGYFVSDLLPEVIHQYAVPGAVDVVTAGVLNAL